MQQHPVFKKYTRNWLHDMTGYSKCYLCRVAIGNVPLSRAFVERVCFKLKQSPEELFELKATEVRSGNGENKN